MLTKQLLLTVAVSLATAAVMAQVFGCDRGGSPGNPANAQTQPQGENPMKQHTGTAPATATASSQPIRVPLGIIDVPEGTPQGEWMEIGGHTPLLWCYRGGKRLVFEQAGPKVYLSYDGGPFSLAGIIVRSREEMLLVNGLPENERGQLALWVYSPHLVHLKDVSSPEAIDSIQAWEWGRGLLNDLSPLVRTTRLTSLCARDCPKLADLSPLSGLGKLSSLDVNQTAVAGLAPLREVPIQWIDIRVTDIPNEAFSELAHFRSLVVLKTRWDGQYGPWAMQELLPKLPLLHTLWVIGSVDVNKDGRTIAFPGACKALRTLVYEDIGGAPNLTPLGSLSGLEELRLLGNMTAATNLAGIGKLDRLVTLRVRVAADLTDQETAFDLSPLLKLEQLRVLDVSCEAPTVGHEGIGTLPHLEALTLRTPSLKQVPAFRNPKKLRFLDVARDPAWLVDPSLADISSLADLSNLETLNLSRCSRVADYSALSRLTNLKRLNLDRPGATSLKALKDLSRLEVLSLQNSSINDLSPIGAIESLRELDLRHVDDGLGDVEHLLALDGIARMPHLASLELRQAKAAGLSKLRLPSLMALSLPVNVTSTEFVAIIRSHSGLVSLDATSPPWQDAELSSDALATLSTLHKIHTLHVTGLADLSILADLRLLTELRIPWCKGTPDMSGLRHLEHLRQLGGASVSAPIKIEALDDLRNLFHVGWVDVDIQPRTPTLVKRGTHF